MEFNRYNNMYFIGIGGIGMSALARYFNNKMNIFGYDRVKSSLCIQLEGEGMQIHYKEDVNQISVKKEDTLIVYTPAISSNHLELSYFLTHNYIVMKRSEVLGKITEDHFTIAVAGTHGKTTTSTMIAHLLSSSNKNCTAFLGGISKNYNSNFIQNGDSDVIVVEADEYDYSFLTLYPDVAIITSLDLDHLDIYGNEQNIISSFQSFSHNIKSGGTLILEGNIDTSLFVKDDISVIRYSTNLDVMNIAENINHESGSVKFDISLNNCKIDGFHMNMPGEYNVSNALASLSVSQLLGLSNQQLRSGILSFLGIERRFDILESNLDVVYIDDYAHHPVEIFSVLSAVRKVYPNRHMTVVFQPHLYSRTNDLIEDFAESLSLADDLILLDIYAAREENIYDVTSNDLLKICRNKVKTLSNMDSVLDLISNKDLDVIITLGAGNISDIVSKIKDNIS